MIQVGRGEGGAEVSLAQLQTYAQGSAGQDAGAQAATALKQRLGSGGDGLVHPVAGLALRHAFKLHALHLEPRSDQAVEFHAARNGVAPCHSRLLAEHSKRALLHG